MDYCLAMIPRRILPVLFLAGALAGCGALSVVEQKEHDKADIKAALEKYLNSASSINLSSMNWEIKEYNPDRDRAAVTVLFTAKQGGAQMSVNYELQKENGVWVVRKPASGAHPGGAAPPVPPGQLPPGHPSMGTTAPPEKATPPPKKS